MFIEVTAAAKNEKVLINIYSIENISSNKIMNDIANSNIYMKFSDDGNVFYKVLETYNELKTILHNGPSENENRILNFRNI
jgi:hypothetical protein